jgi:biopolymer transport protein ExbD
MSWKVRPEGAAAVEVASPEEVVEGLEDGRWAPTDEVRGPDDRDWVPIDGHPRFVDAVALEPMPAGEGDESNLDMTPLIDVCLVLLVVFIMLMLVANVVIKRLEALNPSNQRVGPAVITPDQVKDQMIVAEVARENGATVYRVEDEVVAADDLQSKLSGFVNATSRTQLLLKHAPTVPHGDVVRIQDAAAGAGIAHVLLLVPPQGQGEKKE